MAEMIPDRCPGKATAGEERLFRVLRDRLPDGFTVWYEPAIDQRYPDFTILAPSFGLLVIEVKGWYPKQITRANDRDVELLMTREGQSHLEAHANPLRQARDYMFLVHDLLAREPLLRQAAGPHQGKLRFPCGYGVAFTNLTRDQLERAGLAVLFPPGQVFCKDALDLAEAAPDGQQVIQLLAKCFTVSFPFPALTKDQVRTIKGRLHPEVVVGERIVSIPPQSSRDGVAEQVRVLEVLDVKQELAARSLGDGHRILFGVAGSGKTVVLLARAKLLARREPGKRILILCYNRCLAAYLGHELRRVGDYRGIEVRNFLSWAAKVTGVFKDGQSESFEEYEKRLCEALLRRTAGWPEEKKYDAIFVDEAPDFQPDWFRCCTSALKGGDAGDLLIAADGAQSIYGRPRSFTWKSVGVNAQGRSRQLKVNYRNTKEIIEFAWAITQNGRQGEADNEIHMRIPPARAKRAGPRPHFQGYARGEEEHAGIVQLVEHYKAEAHPETDIAVLYPRNEGKRIDNLYNALRSVGQVCWVTNAADQKAKDEFVGRPGLRLCSIHSAKGLQFPVVILSAVDQLPSPMSEGQEDDLNLFYVGLTRAREHLVLTWSGRSEFTERVEKSGRANRLTTVSQTFPGLEFLSGGRA
jgi:hypothetical protein